MEFELNYSKNIKLKNPILIEGLPGIGNVGKIAVDFMIENLKANKIIEITSSSFPNVVFVNEKNLVDLPTICIYHKKIKNQDFLFLSGDSQPNNEADSYKLSYKIIEILKKYKTKEIITTGGIGLPKIPKNPKIYATGNSKEIIKKYKTKELNTKIFGVVGPIMGMTGLLVGLSKNKIPAIALLSQTFGHPTYLGITSAREIIKFLNNKFKFGLNIKKLDSEIYEIEEEMKQKSTDIKDIPKKSLVNQETSYIG
ncbi:PAC2 family protein [archaeon]|nr:PAC2 family protein [archaeon]